MSESTVFLRSVINVTLVVYSLITQWQQSPLNKPAFYLNIVISYTIDCMCLDNNVRLCQGLEWGWDMGYRIFLIESFTACILGCLYAGRICPQILFLNAWLDDFIKRPHLQSSGIGWILCKVSDYFIGSYLFYLALHNNNNAYHTK
jgi:hypothetical protein